MVQGVIQGLKTKYRTILVRCIITALDNNKAIPKFNILEAMYMLTRAWDQVTTTTIVNCLKKAKMSATSQIEAMNDSGNPFVDLKYQLAELTRRDSSLLQGDSAENFDNFDINVGSLNGVMTEEEILKVIGDDDDDDHDDDDDDDDDDLDEDKEEG